MAATKFEASTTLIVKNDAGEVVSKVEKEGAGSYDIGSDLEEAVKLHTKDVVFKEYEKGATIDVQAVVRRVLQAGGEQADIDKALAEFKLGEGGRVKVDVMVAAKSKLSTMTPAEQKTYLQEVMAMVQNQQK